MSNTNKTKTNNRAKKAAWLEHQKVFDEEMEAKLFEKQKAKELRQKSNELIEIQRKTQLGAIEVLVDLMKSWDSSCVDTETWLKAKADVVPKDYLVCTSPTLLLDKVSQAMNETKKTVDIILRIELLSSVGGFNKFSLEDFKTVVKFNMVQVMNQPEFLGELEKKLSSFYLARNKFVKSIVEGNCGVLSTEARELLKIQTDIGIFQNILARTKELKTLQP